MDSLRFASDMGIRLVRRAMVNDVKVAIRAASVENPRNHRIPARTEASNIVPSATTRLAQLRLPTTASTRPSHRHL
jgi:hypothetical protein